jgi:hypothetical protein
MGRADARASGHDKQSGQDAEVAAGRFHQYPFFGKGRATCLGQAHKGRKATTV